MRKTSYLTVLILLFFMCGCMAPMHTDPSFASISTSDTPPATSQPEQDSTAQTHQATTEPTEAVTEETTAPADHSMESEIDLTIPSYKPRFDNALDEAQIVVQDYENNVKSYYVRLPVFAAYEKTARFINGRIWTCPDGETMQGNHYDIYIINDSNLERLENYAFSKEYTVNNETFVLELEYALHNGEVLVTYAPAETEGKNALLVDTSRGLNKCLARFSSGSGEDWYSYYALIDLETGAMTDFLAGIESPAFKQQGLKFVRWAEDNSFIMESTYENRILYYFDIPNRQVIKDYQQEPNDQAQLQSQLQFQVDQYHKDGWTYRIYDPLDNETITLRLSKKWSNTKNWKRSDDGRKLIKTKNDDGFFQFLIYDGDANTLVEIQRGDLDTTDESWFWNANGDLIVFSEEHMELCVYSFSQWP